MAAVNRPRRVLSTWTVSPGEKRIHDLDGQAQRFVQARAQGEFVAVTGNEQRLHGRCSALELKTARLRLTSAAKFGPTPSERAKNNVWPRNTPRSAQRCPITSSAFNGADRDLSLPRTVEGADHRRRPGRDGQQLLAEARGKAFLGY